ncbi:alpha/beta fold hydrolase, partial [bacterium]|nr:alpha/beta fold hydrolase [bacterium]
CGDLYVANPKTKNPLVVLLHSFSMTSRVWANLAQDLRKDGYNVLTMDLRGHGRSVYNENLKLKSRYKFSNKQWQKLPKDVVESINYVKSHYPAINCDDIIIVGADIGGSAGILAGLELKKQPLKFVFISPMVNFKGLYLPYKVANYKDTKFLIMLSKTDKILFNFYTTEKPIIKSYPLGGSGNHLVQSTPDAKRDIIDFIKN